MADKNEEQTVRRPGLLRKVANFMQGNSSSLYKSTYYSDPEERYQIQRLSSDINNTIKNIMNNTTDSVGEPNIVKLYERLLSNNTASDRKLVDEFNRIFGDNEFVGNLTSSYLDNRWVKTIDLEIDEICKYMPKLNEALETIADNVLSADSFAKDYLNLENTYGDIKNDEQFARNIDNLKEQYELLKLFEDIYKKTAKYGETFVYCCPYTKAIQRLVDRRENTKTLGIKTDESGMIIESAIDGTTRISFNEMNNNLSSINNKLKEFSLSIEIEDGIISSVVEEAQVVRKRVTEAYKESMYNEMMTEIHEANKFGRIDIERGGRSYAVDDTINRDPKEIRGKLPRHRRFDRTISDVLELPDREDITNDGLMDPNKKDENTIKDMNGCIVKILKRERVVPIILQKVCLGYYYFEFDSTMEMFDERLSSTGLVNTLTGIRSNHRMEAFDSVQRREELLKSISAELAKKIDVKFIDRNQDLKKEIYYILKYNDDFNASLSHTNNIRVSYIPPEDIQHFYFELDEDTGRGISDLNMSLIPAKLWVCITLSNAMGIMSRQNDKRVYYVRQSVESNVYKTLLKTINEIKRGNFNIRQIENINSVLNITGRYNDYIIPRGSDGQSPIDFEILPGQQIDTKEEFLKVLEDYAISRLVPLELIMSRLSPGYATQYTMDNTKFLRFVYKRQSNFEPQASKLATKIYDIEYGVNDRITLKLPPPLFIDVNNTNQLVQQASDLSRNLTDLFGVTTDDEKTKQYILRNIVKRRLGSYIDVDMINDCINAAKQERALEMARNGELEDENNTSGGNMSGENDFNMGEEDMNASGGDMGNPGEIDNNMNLNAGPDMNNLENLNMNGLEEENPQNPPNQQQPQNQQNNQQNPNQNNQQ